MAIPDIVMALIDGLTLLIERLPEFIEKLLDSLIEMLPILFERLAESIPRLITAIIIAIPEIIIALTDAIPEIIGAVVEGIPTIISGIIKALPKIIGKLIMLLPRLVWALVKFIPMLVARIAGGIAKAIVKLVGSAGSFISDTWDSVTDFLGFHTGGMVKPSMAQPESSGDLSMFRALGAQAFAIGGMVNKAAGKSMQDNVPAILQAGEAVLTRAGVRAVGGEAGIRAINSGSSPLTAQPVQSGSYSGQCNHWC